MKTLASVFLLLLSLLASPASAQEAAPTPESDALLTEHREVPDLDSRAPEGPDAGEVALWIPRVLLSPLTLVLDYGIRRPLGLLVTTAERENWDGLLLGLFTWNQQRSAILPTFFLAYGMQPTVGLMFFSNDEVAPGHSIGASLQFGGVEALQGSASYAISSGNGFRVELGGGGGRRPDRVFSGIGWEAQAEQYRFHESWYRGELTLRSDFWRQSALQIRSGVDGHAYDPNGYAVLSNSPSLAQGIAQGAVESPPGLEEGFVAYRQRVEIALDSREPEPAPGHGVRIEGGGELVVDLVDPLGRRWVRYGGGVGAFLDLGDRRVLALWGLARFADPIGPGEVPFTELAALGEQALLMQGFLRGQLRGRSAVASTLEYLYPVWTRLDGRLHISVGNVFDEHLAGFAPERLRLSFGVGIATAGDPDSAMQLTIAAGTAPFVNGTNIDSVQMVLGSRQGF